MKRGKKACDTTIVVKNTLTENFGHTAQHRLRLTTDFPPPTSISANHACSHCEVVPLYVGHVQQWEGLPGLLPRKKEHFTTMSGSLNVLCLIKYKPGTSFHLCRKCQRWVFSGM